MGQGEEGLERRGLGEAYTPSCTHRSTGGRAGVCLDLQYLLRRLSLRLHPLWGPGGFHRQKVPPPHIQRPITDQQLYE